MIKTLLTSTAMVMMLSGAAMAQTSGPTGTTGGTAATPATPAPSGSATTGSTTTTTTTSSSAIQASNLMGLTLRNPQDENIGDIDDVLVTPDGQIEQVVVSVGGFLGIGSKKVAIDWEDVQVTAGANNAVVNMTREQLENAPAWEEPQRESSGSGTGSSGSGAMGGGATGSGGATAPSRTQ